MTNEKHKLNKDTAGMFKGGVIMDVTTPQQERLQRLPERVQLWLLKEFLQISELPVGFPE